MKLIVTDQTAIINAYYGEIIYVESKGKFYIYEVKIPSNQLVIEGYAAGINFTVIDCSDDNFFNENEFKINKWLWSSDLSEIIINPNYIPVG